MNFQLLNIMVTKISNYILSNFPNTDYTFRIIERKLVMTDYTE